jgi:hypothetical protein
MGCSFSKRQKDHDETIVFPVRLFLMHKDITEWEKNDYNKRNRERNSLFKFMG